MLVISALKIEVHFRIQNFFFRCNCMKNHYSHCYSNVCIHCFTYCFILFFQYVGILSSNNNFESFLCVVVPILLHSVPCIILWWRLRFSANSITGNFVVKQICQINKLHYGCFFLQMAPLGIFFCTLQQTLHKSKKCIELFLTNVCLSSPVRR